MLERTAGCLENAGRRFLRDSNRSIRGRKSLYSKFGHYNGAGAECSQQTLASRSALQQRVSSTSATTPSTPATSNDRRTPFLEFLYPSRTQEFVATCLLRSPKGIITRRRRRAGPNVSRTFVSGATGLLQLEGVDTPTDIHHMPAREMMQAKDSLLKLLNEGGPEETDRVWDLYVKAGHPPDVNPALLARLSDSGKDIDHRRAKRLFLAIDDKLQSPGDYLHLAKTHIAVGKLSDLKKICIEAQVKGLGTPCVAFALAHFANHAQWLSAKDIWDLRSTVDEDELWKLMASYLTPSSFAKSLLDLPLILQHDIVDNSARDLARFLLSHALSTLKIVDDIPTEALLLLLQKHNFAGALLPEHYFRLIETLQSSDVRSSFVRSIVVYRNFRWLMDKEVPAAKLLGGFVKHLAAFKITTGIHYFLDEFAYFYSKPAVDVYKHALVAFSRAGDVSNVELVFAKLVSDHGKPRSQRLLTPLLYVHARLGNVKETTAQFKRVSDEFGFKQNIVCWNILLTAYANADDLPGCFTQFKQMIESGMEPTSHTFGILMGLCANKGDIDTVRQLLALAKQRQAQITVPLLDTIVEAYCNNQKLEMAESVAETCLSLDVKGSRVRMWNMLLWNYAFRMDLESISRIRSRMDAAGLKADDMTYAALMLSLVLLGQTDSARRILRALHRSHRMHATEFHYAIILYGYVKARNRDMVHIIFREMKARYNRPGLSSRLLVLRSQLRRDLQLIEDRGTRANTANLSLENAERFLAETIREFNPAKLATKQPVPGANKQPLSNAFPAMFYESVITAYGKKGASDKVRELFDEFINHQRPSTTPENTHDIAPLRLLAALMLTYLKADQHKKVEDCWKMAFPRARKIASRVNDSGWLSSQLPPAGSLDPPRPPMPKSNGKNDVLLVAASDDRGSSHHSKKSPVLPVYRFILSRPLSIYMRSLAYRNECRRIFKVISDVEKAGFTLTTFNWSTVVQMFASSEKPSDQLEAFAIFEKKFMPNFPGWNNLRRGYGLKPRGVPSTIDILENPSRGKHPDALGKEGRRYWSKIHPDFMQPTYVSMVYLASALLGVRERSISDGGAELTALHSVAPKTIEAIADMPYLREKFQGVLLRRREEQGDVKGDLASREQFVWTGGILGVGGRRRVPLGGVESSTEPPYQDDNTTEDSFEPEVESPQPDALSYFANTTEDPVSGDMQPPETIDYQDEYDLEAEAALATRRRLLGTNDELLDNEHPDISSEEYEEHEEHEEYEEYEDESRPLVDESVLTNDQGPKDSQQENQEQV